MWLKTNACADFLAKQGVTASDIVHVFFFFFYKIPHVLNLLMTRDKNESFIRCNH